MHVSVVAVGTRSRIGVRTWLCLGLYASDAKGRLVLSSGRPWEAMSSVAPSATPHTIECQGARAEAAFRAGRKGGLRARGRASAVSRDLREARRSEVGDVLLSMSMTLCIRSSGTGTRAPMAGHVCVHGSLLHPHRPSVFGTTAPNKCPVDFGHASSFLMGFKPFIVNT